MVLQAGGRLSRFEITEPSLNQIFIDEVGRDATHAEAREDEHA